MQFGPIELCLEQVVKDARLLLIKREFAAITIVRSKSVLAFISFIDASDDELGVFNGELGRTIRLLRQVLHEVAHHGHCRDDVSIALRELEKPAILRKARPSLNCLAVVQPVHVVSEAHGQGERRMKRLLVALSIHCPACLTDQAHRFLHGAEDRPDELRSVFF